MALASCRTISSRPASSTSTRASRSRRSHRPKISQPLIYGSADNLVAAFYDHGGKRAILDGGFTRLYLKWDTAGTARYVKNSAAWLANSERFHDIVAVKSETPTPPLAVHHPQPSASTPPMAQDDGPSAWIGAIILAVVLGLGLVFLIPLWWRSRV